MRTIEQKIQPLDYLETNLANLRKKKKKIVLCHGVFDLIHPGHILYFQAAKKQGDVLVVTVTPDQYVNKGPGRPIFNQRLRMESIAALECVDYVALNQWPTAEKTIRKLKPHIYAKGQDYANAASDITGQIKNEMLAIKNVGGKTVFTNEEMYSSSALINKFFSAFPPATHHYLQEFRKKYSSHDILAMLKEIACLRVLVIGEAILDQYCYCNPMAKSPKETIVASRFLSEENFAGGTMAIANHLAGFCDHVSLVTCLGQESKIQGFFRKKLNRKINLHTVRLKGTPTITKRRYVEPNFLTKMFEIQYLDDSPLSSPEEQMVVNMLRNLLPQHDVVVVADYGHGFFTDRIRDEISGLSKFLCVNTQTNSANYGFNVATKYHKVNFISIDEPELKLALRLKYGDIPEMALKLRREIKADVLLVSRGPNGSIMIDRNEVLQETPVFSNRVVDRIGAGDALFSITSPSVFKQFPIDVIGFLGNCAGAMAVEIVCNREPIDPITFAKFVTGLLK